MIAAHDGHLHADVIPPVQPGSDREHDPVLWWRFVVAGWNQKTGAAHPVRVELLDDNSIKQGPQFVAHARDANEGRNWDAARMAHSDALSDPQGIVTDLRKAGPLSVAVMVSSVDGRATVDGRVGELTGGPDQQVLLGVRELASALIVGGGTVKAEGYEGLLDDDAKARRRARGMAPEPDFVVFTRQSGDLTTLWRQMRARHPDGLIVCEGGPTLLGLAVEHQLLDELVLCISPRIVGGDDEKRLLEHAGALGVELELLQVASAENFLFLRYRTLLG